MRFVGHSTVRLEIAGTVLLTDPVLGARVGPLLRIGPAPSPGAWVDTDLVLLSHLHGDHLHLPSLRLLSAVGARVVVPRGAGDWLRARGVKRVDELAPGETLAHERLLVTGVPAAHSGHRWGPRSTRGPQARAMGHLIEAGDVTVYAAGRHRPLRRDGRAAAPGRRAAAGVGLGPDAGARPPEPAARRRGGGPAAAAGRGAGALGHVRAGRAGPRAGAAGRPDAPAAGRPAAGVRRRGGDRRAADRRPGHPAGTGRRAPGRACGERG